MDVNIVRPVYIFMTFWIGVVGLLINCGEPYIPVFISQGFRYGKFASKSYHPLVAKTEIPKSWFRHFYIFAGPASLCVLYLTYRTYFLNGTVPDIVYSILDLGFGTSRQPLISAENTFLTVALLSLQCCKRLYETLFVNVFSDKTMNLSHYVAGILHYAGLMLVVLAESEGFVRGSKGIFIWEKLTLLQSVCVIIFVWSWYQQFNCNLILRDLRKNEKGVVVASGYKIPYGGCFDYVSGALQFTEIILYILYSILLWQNSTVHSVTVWVIVNQVECALLTHWWYQEKFKNYPRERKILIPYLF